MNLFCTLGLLVIVAILKPVKSDVRELVKTKEGANGLTGPYSYPKPSESKYVNHYSPLYRHSKPKAIDDPLPAKVNYVHPVVLDFQQEEEQQWKPIFAPVFAPSYLTPKEEVLPPVDKYRHKLDNKRHTTTRKPYSSADSWNNYKSVGKTEAIRNENTTTKRYTTTPTTTTRKPTTSRSTTKSSKLSTTTKRVTTTKKSKSITTKPPTSHSLSSTTNSLHTKTSSSTTKTMSASTVISSKTPAEHKPNYFEPQSMEDEYKPQMEYPAKFHAFHTPEEDMVYINHHHGPKTNFELFNVHDQIPLLSSPPEVIYKPGDDTSFADDLTVIDDYEHTFRPQIIVVAGSDEQVQSLISKLSDATTKTTTESSLPKSEDVANGNEMANSMHGYVYEKPAVSFDT